MTKFPTCGECLRVSSSRIPEATVARLPVYLRALNSMSDAGTTTCSSRGFRTVALLDADDSRQGELVAGLEIRSFEDLEQVVAEHGVGIGVIATPAIAAQAVCDRMVQAGIRSILNFAPTILSVPEGVDVRRVDLSSELQILAYHEQRKSSAALREEAI